MYKSSIEFVLRYYIAFLLFVLSLCAYQLARQGSYRDPGSAFFDSSRAYERKYSDYRLEETKGIDLVQQPTHKASTCIIFTTWKRPIEVTIKSAVAGLSPQERADMHLVVLFAHSDPTTHPSWGIKVDDSISYKTIAQDQLSRLTDLEEKDDVSHKGVEDYALALEYCMNTKLPWAAVFEDDVIFADGWYANLKQATLEPDSDFESMLYLRMFNDERATGWSKQGFFVNGEIYIGAVLDSVALLVLRRRPWSTILPVILFIPCMVALFYASGKATMLPPSPGVREENFGCCSQALIFPHHQLQPLSTYLRETGAGQVDLLVNQFGREHNYRRKSIYPMLVQHRGAIAGSVRGTTAKEAKQIWSMAFENLDPKKLRKKHDELVTKLWPNSSSEPF